MSAVQAGAEHNPLQDASSLRLPVPFFDLLMVLLVTCLVFVAPLPPEGQIQAMDVAIAHGKSAPSADTLLPVIPKRSSGGWSFELSGKGQIITPAELAERATAEGRKVVLVVPPATELQDFVSMQTELAAANIPFALAIRSKETAP